MTWGRVQDLLGREEAVSCHRLHTSVWYFERRLVVVEGRVVVAPGGLINSSKLF